jgi:hypothetical protein
VIILLGIFSLADSANLRSTAATQPANWVPIHEIAAAVGFTLLPVAGVILAKTITGAFTDRYAMAGVIGVSILLAWSLSCRLDCRPGLGLAITAVIFGMFVALAVRSQRNLAKSVQEEAATYRFLQSQSGVGKIPVVIAAPHLFFELSHYSAGRRAIELIYLADIPLALEYTGTDTVERGLLELKRWAPLNVEDFHRFCASHGEFLIYGYPDLYGWLNQELIRQGRQLVVTARNGDQLLFLVTPQSVQSQPNLGPDAENRRLRNPVPAG